MKKNEGKGEVFYGLHFYPGVAEYQEPGGDPYRVFLNEDTLRKMDDSFAGRPVFVQHVDDVKANVDALRYDADGWVIKSFYNAADGKHWVQFIVCSENGLRAIRNGMRLSNCYIPKSTTSGGLWNGVEYAKEITNGEYEHLAIVPNPRYEESVILTPEQFKKYNDDKEIELKRLSNEREGQGMLKFFKRAKVENGVEFESMSVVLPKSGKEMTLLQIVNAMDEHEEKKDMNDGMADPSHKVKMHDGSYCNVAELVEKHKALHDELEVMKEKKDSEDQDMEYSETDPDPIEAGVKENDDEDKDAKKKALELAAHEDKEMKEEKAKNAREKAERLRNAPVMAAIKASREEQVVMTSSERVARGKQLFGS